MAVARARRAWANGNPSPAAIRSIGLDDIDAGHHFGDGVLDLKARIDFQKIVAVAAHDEFDRADPAIVQALAEPHRVGDHPVAQRGGKIGGRGFLDQLLVTPLQRTFTLEQVNHVAVAVAGDLYFDMAPTLDQLFDDQPGIAERVFRLAHGGFDFTGETIELRRRHACPCRRRPPQPSASPEARVHATMPAISAASSLGRLAAGHGRDAGRLGLALGGRLVAKPLDDLGGRADEDQARRLDRARECGILGQKAEPGMNGLRAGASSPPRSRRRSADSCRRRRRRRSRWTRRSS